MEDRGEYILEMIQNMVVVMLLYSVTIFRELPGWTVKGSVAVYAVMCIIIVTVECFFCQPRERTSFNRWMTALLMPVLYTLMAYRKYAPFFSKGLVVLASTFGAIAVLYILVVMLLPCAKGKSKVTVLKRRLYRSIVVVRALFVICGLIFVLPIAKDLRNTGIRAVEVRPADTVVHSEENTIDANLEKLVGFHEDYWDTLSLQQRLDLVQVVANIERNYLGIPFALPVKGAYLDGSKAGFYNRDAKEITVDLWVLEGSAAEDAHLKTLEIITHEAHHAYAHSMAEMYAAVDEEYKSLLLLWDAARYTEEFEAYVSGEDNFEDYYYQKLEQDARSYSDDAVWDYYDRIKEYVAEQEGKI